MTYSGYLSPYVEIIKQAATEGFTATEISRHLYLHGVRATWGSHSGEDEDNIRSMTGMVNYIIRGGNKKKPKKATRVTVVTLPWQTWTPEMQEAEFQLGYSR